MRNASWMESWDTTLEYVTLVWAWVMCPCEIHLDVKDHVALNLGRALPAQATLMLTLSWDIQVTWTLHSSFSMALVQKSVPVSLSICKLCQQIWVLGSKTCV